MFPFLNPFFNDLTMFNNLFIQAFRFKLWFVQLFHFVRYVHKSLLFALCASSLLACSPTYDWRTVRLTPQDQGLSVEFPAKPSYAQKQITLNGQSLTMTQTASMVNTTQFALASVPAPNEAAALALANVMAQGFANNLQAALASTKPVSVLQTSGAFEQSYRTATFTAQARFIWTAGAAYQVIAIAPLADLNADAAEQFIRSIRFE